MVSLCSPMGQHKCRGGVISPYKVSLRSTAQLTEPLQPFTSDYDGRYPVAFFDKVWSVRAAAIYVPLWCVKRPVLLIRPLLCSVYERDL